MATTVTFNNTSYSIPANREPRGWGTSLSLFLVDVANSSLSKAGGSFTLTADANFGTSYGLVSKYIKYSSGQLTMNTSGTLTLPNATDTLVGKDTTDILTNKTLVAPALGTPASGVLTNCTGTAAGLTAGNVTTNANLTGDVTSSGNATTLATVLATTPGSYGTATAVPTFTVNGKGLITAASGTNIQLGSSAAVTGLDTALALLAPKASPTFTGTMLNALGALGTPSYSFSGDTDTGIWSSAGGFVNLSTDGVLGLTISAGATSPVVRVGKQTNNAFSNAACLTLATGTGNNGRLATFCYDNTNPPLHISVGQGSGIPSIMWGALEQTSVNNTQIYALASTTTAKISSDASVARAFVLQVAPAGTINTQITWSDAAVVSSAGAWTFGAANSNVHIITGALQFAASASAPAARSIGAGGNQLQFFAGSSGFGFVNSTNTTVIGSTTDAGAWTLGGTGVAHTHTLNGNILTFAPGTGSTVEIAAGGASSTNLQLSAKGASGGIQFYCNAGAKGDVNPSGAWTLGASSGLTTTHTIQNSSTSVNALLTLKKLNGLGDISSNYYFDFYNEAYNQGYLWNNASGNLELTTASDASLKENIRDADYGLSQLMALRPVTFDWKSGAALDVRGFIAQEVQTVLPRCVNQSPDGTLQLGKDEFFPIMVKAIQELSAKNDALEARLAALESV